MKEINARKIKPTLKEDWWLFCDGYLKLAELSCKEMIDQKYSMFQNRERGPNAFWIYDLYIPTIYNLKHSIEIFLKYFCIILTDQIPDLDHNIEKFLSIFTEKSQLTKINKIVKKAYADKKESRYSLSTAEMETNYSEEWLNNLSKITLKYFYCEDVKQKIGKFDLIDVKNDGFRYPLNNLKINLNYSDLVHRIDKKDVAVVLSDIYELKNSFGSLRFLIDVYHDIK